MSDISGFGLTVNIKTQATGTFPAGVIITQLADDADPFDVPSIQIADKAMGVNGDLLTWSKPNPINITLSVAPNTEDDENLAILLEANRVGKGKRGARDVLTMVAVYPDGRTVTLTPGAITDGPPMNSVTSSARMKSKSYMFTFENKRS